MEVQGCIEPFARYGFPSTCLTMDMKSVEVELIELYLALRGFIS